MGAIQRSRRKRASRTVRQSQVEHVVDGTGVSSTVTGYGIVCGPMSYQRQEDVCPDRETETVKEGTTRTQGGGWMNWTRWIGMDYGIRIDTLARALCQLEGDMELESQACLDRIEEIAQYRKQLRREVYRD